MSPPQQQALRHSRIAKLDESVVNKIAAGEVIQRPHNALKEILENAIDAGADRITVVVRDGGNRSIQVQDNGSGIHKEDLALLCERHATSKLTDFEDLRNMQTLGFRGEALCSISYVAHLTVTTMTEGDTHATKTVYRNSTIEDGPKACAGLVGTTICIEDLFYNMPIRKKALKSTSEELARVLEVVGRYAIFHDGVGITLKRYGQQRPDVCTNQKDTKLEKIRSVFGSQLGSNLLHFKAGSGDEEEEGKVVDEETFVFSADGYASSANYSKVLKRTVMILFINGRLVECTPLKRCLETIYASVLPKSSKPFFYLSIRMPPSHVDVNVHPTKKEVHFLHKDEMIEAIREAIEQAVFSSNDQRTFLKQTLLPGATQVNLDEEPDKGSSRDNSKSTTKRNRAGGDYKLVRTDAHEKKLETFFFSQERKKVLPQEEEENANNLPAASEEDLEGEDAIAAKKARLGSSFQDEGLLGNRQEIALSQVVPTQVDPEELAEASGKESCSLTSVKELLEESLVDTHRDLSEILKNHVYVGMADEKHALVQHKTKLFLINVKTMSKDMFYQQTLRKFGRLPKLRFAEPLSLEPLVLLALQEEERKGNYEEDVDGDKNEAVKIVVDLLKSKRDMLDEYFSIDLTESGDLVALPLVVVKHVPDMRKLPSFLLALGHDTDWDSEKACFMSVADAIADFYSCAMTWVPSSRSQDPGGDPREEERKDEEHVIQHVVFPRLRTLLKPSAKRATDATVVQVGSLERLYRIFERC